MLKNEDKWNCLQTTNIIQSSKSYTTAISKQCENIEKYQKENAYILNFNWREFRV